MHPGIFDGPNAGTQVQKRTRIEKQECEMHPGIFDGPKSTQYAGSVAMGFLQRFIQYKQII